GDIYSPYIKQEEPLKTECQHFLDCIRAGKTPLTCGERGLGLVRILEASSASLKQNGAAISLISSGAPAAAAVGNGNGNGNGHSHDGNGSGKHKNGSVVKRGGRLGHTRAMAL